MTSPSPHPRPHPISFTPVALLFIYSLVFLTTMIFLFLRNNRQPLKARSPGLLAVSSIGGYLQVIWVTMIASNFINPVHGCSFGAWALVLGHPLLFIPYVLRCYRLHLIFNLAVEKRTASAGTSTTTSRSTSTGSTTDHHLAIKYYHARKHRISDTFLLRTMAIVVFLAVCVAAVDEYFVWQGIASWERLLVCNYHSKYTIIVWDTVRFLETLIFTVSLYKLWGVADAFSIRMELLGVCGVWIANLTLRVVLGIYHPESELWVSVQPYAIVARSSVCLFVSVIVPVVLTMLGRVRSGIMLWSENAALASLRETLHDPLFQDAFQKFLVKRFSVENVLFWMEIELYRAAAVSNGGGSHSFYESLGSGLDADRMYYSEEADRGRTGIDSHLQLQEEAKAIAERYLMVGAHLELSVLNTKTVMKRNLQRDIEAGRCTPDLFDHAQQIVYEHMQNECWDDFLNSSDCRKARRKVKKQETIRSALIENGMIDRNER